MIVKDCFFALSNFSIVVLYGPLWKLLSTFFSFNKFYGSYKILGCWESDGTFLHRKVCHDFPDSLIILICVIHPCVHNHHQVEEVKFKVVKVRPCPIWSVGRYLGLNELMSMGPWSDHVSVIKDTSESLIFFSVFCRVRTQWRWLAASQEKSLTADLIVWYYDLGLPSFQNTDDINFCHFMPPDEYCFLMTAWERDMQLEFRTGVDK